jgi:hypothetical protein
VCEKWDKQGYDAFSPQEKVWANVAALIGETENGGLIAFFYNSAADTLPDCLAALDTLGAEDVRRQVERVIVLFPGGVPGTLAGRNDIIESWTYGQYDDLLDEVNRRLYSLFGALEETLETYLLDQGLVVPSD